MRSKQNTNLFEGGRRAWENTEEYQQQVRLIEKEVREKYSNRRQGKKNNWIRIVLTSLRIELEIARRIRQLNSPGNLHIGHGIARY